jgi:hypothetical protein
MSGGNFDGGRCKREGRRENNLSAPFALPRG